MALTIDSVENIVLELEKSGIEVVKFVANVSVDLQKQGVRVATMHRSKSLEFVAVAILFLSDSDYPSHGILQNAVDEANKMVIMERYKSLLHVAPTRAKNALRISWNGQPPKLVS